MSRSFYVDSLIVKEPSTLSKVCRSDGSPPSSDHRRSTTSPKTASPPSSHMSALHPVPCYPRHPADPFNFCCPLYIPTPAQLYADRAMKHFVSSSPITTLSTLPLNYSTVVTSADIHMRNIEVKPQTLTSPMKSRNLGLDRSVELPSQPGDRTSPRTPTSLTEHSRIRYGSLGKKWTHCCSNK